MKSKRNCLIMGFTLMAILGLLSSCSGGGGSSSSSTTTTPVSNTVSGIAAAGAPIAGIVNIKGANGGTASSSIGLDGLYSIDVSSINAPYILFATGSVNGRSLTIYSAGLAAGTINITPLTDFILRNALADSVDSAFANWENAQVDGASLSAAETDAQAQLQPLLEAVGVGADIDLISTPFSADHTGIDAALDSLDISYNGNTATVVNTLTGSSFTDDITLSGDGAGLPATDTAVVQTALTDAQAINAIYHELAAMITTDPYPSAQTWTDWVDANVAPDYLSSGQSRSEILDDILEDDEPLGSLTFDAVIIEPLDIAGTGYIRGYWIRVYEEEDNFQDSFVEAVVHNGVDWAIYGDQKWLDVNDVNPHAFYADFFGTFGTGFELGLDDDFNYAFNQGVRAAIVTGPGLPADGVLLEHQFPETFIGLFANGGSFYEITDDALVATIPDNAEYTHTLCSEMADTLNANGHNTCTVLDSYTTTTMKPPLPKSALDAAMFPALTNPNSHDLSVLNFGGLINVSISTPVGKSIGDDVALCWQMISGDSYCADAEIENSTATLDTIGLPAPDTGWASIFVRAADLYGRDFNRHWWFSNF